MMLSHELTIFDEGRDVLPLHISRAKLANISHLPKFSTNFFKFIVLTIVQFAILSKKSEPRPMCGGVG